MAKLSQQLAEKGGVQTRASRTQRVAQQQEFKREKRSFENAKAKAEELQKTEFANLTTVAEYRAKYNALKPEVKQFFATPDQVEAERSARIEQAKLSVQEKIKETELKAQEKKEYYREREKYYQKKAKEYLEKGDDKRADNYYKKAQDYDDKQEEYEEYYDGIIKGLKEGQSKLSSDKDISFESIYSYAKDIGRYERDRQEAKNDARSYEGAQARKIEDLEEAGYKPQIIKQYYKGNPESVSLSYYNAEKGDWVKIQKFDVDTKVDVSNLKKLGYSEPQQSTLSFAGKDYKFNSRVGIYKDTSGEIVTPYAKTGITEQQLIKQSQDQAYKDWQDKNPPKINIPFKEIKQSDLPIGYGGQQSISSEQRSILIPESQYYLREETKNPLGFVWDKTKQGFNWVDERVNWDFSITGSPSFPKINLISFGKKEKSGRDVFEITEKRLDDVSQGIEEKTIGKENIESFQTGLEDKYSGQYQSSFEQKYMKDLIYNQTTFEEASAEFKQSDEAKIIQKKYEEEYKTGYKDLQTDVPFWRGTLGGVEQTGIGLTKFSVSAFKSPLRTATTVGGVYGGVKLLGAIPPVVSYGVTGGLFAYGTYKFVDPESTYIERGGGLVTAVISGATLGYAGYRYAKSPSITTKTIKPPKATLKSSSVIGKDVKVLTDQGSVNKVIFENQKLSQVGQAGRRTIVTSKWRAFSNKYLGTDFKNIYEGIPSLQPAKYTRLTSVRGTTVVKTAPSGYEKTLKYLQDYGWTEAQARSTLRYFAPRVTEQYLSKGVLTVKGGKAIGEFEYLTKRPVIDVDKSLGIKTRGASPIKDVYDVERKLVNLKSGGVGVFEQKTRITSILDKYGRVKEFTSGQFSQSFNLGKASDLRKGFEYQKVGGVDVYTEAQYKDLFTVGFERNIFPRDNILRVDASQTQLINKIVDLRAQQGVIKPANIKKTPFSKTFGIDNIDKFDDVAFTGGSGKASDYKKVIDKLDTFGSKVSTPARSEYYGTGLYERTDAVTTRNLQQQLKGVVAPEQIRVASIKNLIQIKEINALAGLNVGNLASIKTATGLKTDIKFKSSLDVKDNIKVDLAEDLAIKSAQDFALKTSPALKSQLKSLLDLGSGVSATPPAQSFRPPKIPNIQPPSIKPPVILPFLKAKVSKRSNANLNKAVYDQAYLPDFTSRALGLAPETVTEKQAKKKLKQLLTGLEIRRGVRIA